MRRSAKYTRFLHFFFDGAELAGAFAELATGSAGGPDYRNQGSSTDLDV